MPPTIDEKLDAIEKGVGSVVKDLDDVKTFRKQTEERMASVEEWRKNFGPRTTSLPGCDEGKDAGKFSLGLAILGVGSNWGAPELMKDTETKERAGYTREVLEQTTQKRTMETGTDSKGGYAVPVQIQKGIIEKLRPMSVVIAMGATELRDLVGAPVEMIKETGVPTVSEYPENNDGINFSDASIGKFSLSPKMLAAGVKFTRRFLAMAVPALENQIRGRLASELALRLDYNTLRGDGTANKPLGIVNWPGINSVAMADPNGGAISYAKLLEMEGKLEDANALERDPSGYGFIFHGKIRRKIAGLLDSTNRPLFQPDVTSSTKAKALLGYKYRVSNQLPTNLTKGEGTNLSEVILAYWPDLLIGYWGTMLIEATDQGAGTFEKHQVAVKIVQDYDSGVARPESFVVSSDVQSA